jgi:hypothetical protein
MKTPRRTLPAHMVTLDGASSAFELHPTTVALFEKAKAHPLTAAQLSALNARRQTPMAPRPVMSPDPAREAVLDKQIADLQHDGRVARMSAAQVKPATPAVQLTGMQARVVAIEEWKTDATLSKRFTSIGNYVAAREAEITGKLRTIGTR